MAVSRAHDSSTRQTIRCFGATSWLFAGFLAAASATESPEAVFSDLADSGVDFVRFNGIAGDYLLPEITCAGAALVDYDLDGDLDLYLLQGGLLDTSAEEAETLFPRPRPAELRDRLYRNDLVLDSTGRPTPRFVDVTTASGSAARGYGCGVAAGDYDRDGWPDLYVANLGPNQLLRNQGDGSLLDVTSASGTDDPRWSVPATWLDFDGDGWLDLYVGTYLEFEGVRQKTCRATTGARDYCNPAAYSGEPDRLFRNLGDGSFESVPLGSPDRPVASKSLGVVAGDFNGDGLPDLYVTNDGVANQLWIQRPDGGFVDEALVAGSALNRQGQPEASMGVDAADVDGDGDLDLLMTHLVGETNTLYLNDGHGNFRDTTVSSGLGPPSWGFTGWGLGWADYDNDGLIDVAIANGAVRAIEESARRGEVFPFHQTNQLFRGESGLRHSDITATAGPAFERAEVSRTLARGDLDNDGDVDLVLVNIADKARVLLNNAGDDAHFVAVGLGGATATGAARGARAALIRSGRSPLWRWSRPDGSFGASNDPRLHFGLGAEPGEPSLRIYWPDGRTVLAGPLAVDRYIAIAPRRP